MSPTARIVHRSAAPTADEIDRHLPACPSYPAVWREYPIGRMSKHDGQGIDLALNLARWKLPQGLLGWAIRSYDPLQVVRYLMTFLRFWLIPTLSYLVAVYAAAALLYELAGKLSGQDALGYSGLTVGAAVFFAFARGRGVRILPVALTSGLLASLPCLLLIGLALPAGRDHVEVFGQLMPAYGALLGAALGITSGAAPNTSFKPNPLRGSA